MECPYLNQSSPLYRLLFAIYRQLVTHVFTLECSLRFSRLTLNVDTGVSTVSFAEDGDGRYEISFEATSYPLPIVQGTADYAIPPDCVISSLEVNRATGWRTVDYGGFSLRYSGQDAFLEVKICLILNQFHFLHY